MRIFSAFPEAIEEIRRDLKEMGTIRQTRTMQDKVIVGNPDFDTYELANYGFTVLKPEYKDLNPTQPWADADWQERMLGITDVPVNPGEAWKLRAEMWTQFLERQKAGHEAFSYTYSERFAAEDQVNNVIEGLKRDINSRQAYIAMWQPRDSKRMGGRRVPCSLGWHLMMREDALDVTYFMRSCDFLNHFQNDIFMSMKLRDYVANELSVRPGKFTQFINSLHVYRKDVHDVF